MLLCVIAFNFFNPGVYKYIWYSPVWLRYFYIYTLPCFNCKWSQCSKL